MTGDSSAAWAISAIARTDSTGYEPTLVSADNMTALVPSMTALATSVASARVGSGAWIIDSSIWVAVITNLPCWVARRIVSFCISGTRGDAGLDAVVAAGDHQAVAEASMISSSAS